MYQVYFDHYPLYDPRDPALLIRDPDVHLAVGEAGAVSFTIDADHPYADRITRLRGILELRSAGVPIFKGRVVKDTQGFNLSREIEAEGLLACLNDSVIPPFAFPEDFLEDAGYQAAASSGNVVAFFLGWLLQQHNSQVGAAQRIELGDVTVADPNNYIARASSEYASTMEVVRQKLEDLMGGYLLPDYSGDVVKLHYYAELPLTNTQEVEYGENLLDLVNSLDGTVTYTAVLPTGAEGLTIAGLADGQVSPGVFKEGRLVYSKSLEDTLGGVRIIRRISWSDVTLAENLRTKAAQQLTTEGIFAQQTIQLKAVDLGGTGDGVARFMVGRMVRLKSSPHGFAATFPLTELDPNIFDPGDTEITLGATVKTASDLAHSQQSAAKEQMGQLQLQVNNQQSEITQLPQVTHTQITEALQSTESFVLSAIEQYAETSGAELEEYKKDVQAKFEVMSDEITMKFTETTTNIENVNGDLQAIVTQLVKHFVFGGDGLTIRAGENTMTLALDNDLISFTKNGQQFGHWDGVDFYTSNIVIEVTKRAQFGNFAAVPRRNGHLSWLKVRG